MSKSSKSGGCGCGCGGSSGGGCGCGGKTSAQCVSGDVGCTTCNDQGFSRPLFFAGQLLTEEDLQALGDYVVGKNRLHNRHLFGDGVVCGLEVTCDPCGGGTVVVQPGYALDCCGNDLLLACPTSLDINAMVRDLRRNLLGGYDCGDPCEDKKRKRREECKPEEPLPPPSPPPPPPPPTPAEAGPSAVTSSRTGVAGMVAPPGSRQPAAQPAAEKPRDTLRHYCLYARYCEEKTDPVSPYATDDGCTFQACQPTRVREGVGFELRCRACKHQGEDILTRLCACSGDFRVTKENAKNADTLEAAARLNTPPRKLYATATLTRADATLAVSNFVKSAESLRSISILAQPRAAAFARTSATAQPDETAQPSTAKKLSTTEKPSTAEKPAAEEKPAAPEAATVNASELENSVLEIRDAASHLAAFYSVDETAKAPGDEQVIAAKRELLRSTEAARVALKTTPANAPEYAYYASILDASEKLAKSDSPNTEFGASELRAMRSGVYLDAQTKSATLQRAQSLREALLDALDASPRIGDCQLRSDVRAISLPTSSEQGGDEQLIAASRALKDAWQRYLLDCVCSAVNPPCATCDDTGVLLACVVVDEATCEVVEICNLKRKFVISPTALRYWLPPLGRLGELLEEFCCGEPLCADEDGLVAGGSKNSLYNMGASSKTARSIVLRLLLGLCDEQTDRASSQGTVTAQPPAQPPSVVGFRTSSSSSASNIMRNLRTFAAKIIEEPRTAPTLLGATARPPAEIVAEGVKDPAARAELLRAFEPELKKAATSRDELTAEIERAVKERVESATNTPEFRRSVAETLKTEEPSAAVRKLVESEVAAARAATAPPDEAAIERKIEERVSAALEKLKPVKDAAELKRAKTENAELKKSLAALEERMKKIEGRA